MLTRVGGACFWGQARPISRERGPSAPHFLDPVFRPIRFYFYLYKTTKSRIAAGRVFKGSAKPHCSGVGPLRSQIFWDPTYAHVVWGYGTEQSNLGEKRIFPVSTMGWIGVQNIVGWSALDEEKCTCLP